MTSFDAGQIALVLFFGLATVALGLSAAIEWIIIPAIVERDMRRVYEKLREIEREPDYDE